MGRKKKITVVLCVALVLSMTAGCGAGTGNTVAKTENTQTNTEDALTKMGDTQDTRTKQESTQADTQTKQEDAQADTGDTRTKQENTQADMEDVQTGQEDDPAKSEDAHKKPGDSAAADTGKKFKCNPRAYSAYTEEIFTKEMIRAWNNLLDAFFAGEDTFECADQDTYSWMIHYFPAHYFPVMGELIEPVYGDVVENGVAPFEYTTTREEREKKVAEFEQLVEDILNTTMKDGYSDLEKALSLYQYFSSHYVYDTETYWRMEEEFVEDTDAYRLLTTGHGICSEVASAYSFLLMQAGVDATIMAAQSDVTDSHEWSYVRIHGKSYHVDPTFALGTDSQMAYFMMTDEQRHETYAYNDLFIAGVYGQEHQIQVEKAEDDTYRPWWDWYMTGLDPVKNVFSYYYFDESGNHLEAEYEYEE